MQLVLAYGVCSAQHAGWRADQRCTGRGGTLLFDNRSPTVSTSKGILQLESSDVSSRRSARRMKGMPNLTIIGLLEKISVMPEFSACGPKIRHILK
ncbi:hypothetical protein KXX26_003310, partial [Aspergillus fumigatus]